MKNSKYECGGSCVMQGRASDALRQREHVRPADWHSAIQQGATLRHAGSQRDGPGNIPGIPGVCRGLPRILTTEGPYYRDSREFPGGGPFWAARQHRPTGIKLAMQSGWFPGVAGIFRLFSGFSAPFSVLRACFENGIFMQQPDV